MSQTALYAESSAQYRKTYPLKKGEEPHMFYEAVNRYQIGEPIGGRLIAAPALALVLMPLVGMDNAGNRLGNGAGYYDRWLAFRLGRRGTPLLVGLAFECQRQAFIEPQAHDVPLDAVITENGLQLFAPRH